jgi:gliding motility-associated-like protein
VRITVNRPAKLVFNEMETLCKGSSKKLLVSGASAYQWSPATGLSSTTVSSPVASPAENTTYRVVGHVNNACGNDTGYIHVKVAANPTVDAGRDKTIAAGTFVDLDPLVSPDVTEANWSPTDELSRFGSYGVTVRPSKNTDYTIEVRNSDGCTAKDKVSIVLTCTANNVFIPNTFSPNNDGMNDVFFVRGTGLYKIRSLRIFNRWGEMVFSKYDFMANDPVYGWDGRYKGKPMPTDVFVYIAEIVCGNGTVIPYNGNISLVN